MKVLFFHNECRIIDKKWQRLLTDPNYGPYLSISIWLIMIIIDYYIYFISNNELNVIYLAFSAKDNVVVFKLHNFRRPSLLDVAKILLLTESSWIQLNRLIGYSWLSDKVTREFSTLLWISHKAMLPTIFVHIKDHRLQYLLQPNNYWYYFYSLHFLLQIVCSYKFQSGNN